MSLDYKWRVNYTAKASDEFRKLSKDLQKRISKKMRFFALSSDLPNYSKKLKDNKYGNYRFRIGDYRVVFDKLTKQKRYLSLKFLKETKFTNNLGGLAEWFKAYACPDFSSSTESRDRKIEDPRQFYFLYGGEVA